jgi:hypothetical protein
MIIPLVLLSAVALLASLWPELFTNHIPHELGITKDKK